MSRRPESQNDYIRVIGKEATVKLCAEYGGESIYVPKLESILDQRSAEIIRDYNGYNVRMLAKRYNLTERRIYQIVQGAGIQQLDGQLSLDDMLRAKD